ncbi:MAG: hypothetical protein QHI38_07975 [Armatimonadota bacterium]|nr:hypothetical protein [Armatimonadota bacterium]
MNRQAVEKQVNIFRKRVRLLLIERGALFGASAGMTFSAVLAALSCRFDVLINYPLWTAVPLAGAAGGFLYGLLRPLDDLAVAALTDKRANLRERLSTALALSRQSDAATAHESDVLRALINDAVERASKLDAGRVFPHKFGLPHAAFGVGTLLFAAAIVLPVCPAIQSENRRAEVRVMKREGAKLVRIAKEIRREAGSKQAEMQKLAARLEELGRKIESGRMSKKQAMLKAHRLTKEIRERQDQLAKAHGATKPMDRAAADIRKASEQLAKEMAAKLAADKNIPFEQAMKQLPHNTKLAKLAEKPGTLSPEEQNALEKMLAKFAAPGSTIRIPPELAAAFAKLLSNEDYRQAIKLLQALAKKLNLPTDTSKITPADREALRKQLEALAKALKNTELDKLAKALLDNARKLAAMSPEELEKLVKELEQMRRMKRWLAKAKGG